MLIAVYLGFHTGGTVAGFIEFVLPQLSYWTLILLSPLIIFALVLKAQSCVNDQGIKTLPLKSKQILHPLIISVLVSWLRLFLPIIIGALFSQCILHLESNDYSDNPIFYWQLSFIRNLRLIPYHLPQLDPYYATYGIGTPFWMRTIIIILGLGQCVSWAMLPVMWGFWAANRFGTTKSAFFVSYFSWLIMPVALWFFKDRLFPEDFVRMFVGWTYDLSRIREFYSMIIVGISGIIATPVFYYLALKSWERRDG
ncbi:MAG: hypothetical protein NTY09_03045 [bacterium]|nr:hypothetical protein [bacterium]